MKLARYVNLEKIGAIENNAERIRSSHSVCPPAITSLSTANAEAVRGQAERESLRRLCKAFNIDADMLLAEMDDYMRVTTADWRRAAKWARNMIHAKPERMRL